MFLYNDSGIGTETYLRNRISHDTVHLGGQSYVWYYPQIRSFDTKNAAAKTLWSELLAAQDREKISRQEQDFRYVGARAGGSLANRTNGVIERVFI